MEEKDKNNINNKIILFPVGGEDARKHYKDSVAKTSDLKSFEKYIDAKGINQIYYGENKEFCLWGVGQTPRLNNLYQRIKVNDLVVFVQDNKVKSYGMVLMTIESNEISKKKWGSSDWSNIIFITEVKENVDINTKDLWEELGYMENYVLRGPLIINEEKSDKIIEKHAVLKDSLFTWIEQAKEEHENENGVVNPRIFISYSHADECYKDQLKAHLSLIKMNWTAGIIWDDRKLQFGSNYDIQIEKAIKDTNIHILLISSDYFNSPYCRREFELICETNGIKIPIIVRDCYWRKVLAREDLRYITLPENNSNIFASADKDREYSKIVEKIDEEINKLNNNE